MRSPGYILAHSLPGTANRAQTAFKVADRDAACDALERYCAGLRQNRLEDVRGGGWNGALETVILRARCDAFCNLVGQTLASWYDPLVPLANKISKR